MNPYDINSPDFDPDMYVSRLVSEASLSQLLAQEGEVVRQIQGLDSDMQTLVYENYNKVYIRVSFISIPFKIIFLSVYCCNRDNQEDES